MDLPNLQSGTVGGLAVYVRWSASVLVALGLLLAVRAQTPSSGKPADTADVELVERLIVARKDYQEFCAKQRQSIKLDAGLAQPGTIDEGKAYNHRLRAAAF